MTEAYRNEQLAKARQETADPLTNEFRVPKDADWTKLRACIDEAERREAEGWKVVRS